MATTARTTTARTTSRATTPGVTPAAVGLPRGRGPASTAVVDLLGGGRTSPGEVREAVVAELGRVRRSADEVLRDDDLQLALWTLQELSFRGFGGAGDVWEWDLELVAARRALEGELERALREVA
ncbi:hypothetical protein WDZ17_10595, partial [Pseudokineococcus basanitobsidens]